MMMIDLDTVYSSVLYTIMMMIISFYYYQRGKRQGVYETTRILFKHEPEAMFRINGKLKELINVRKTDA